MHVCVGGGVGCASVRGEGRGCMCWGVGCMCGGVGVYVCKSRGRMCVGDRGCMFAWVGMGACVGG